MAKLLFATDNGKRFNIKLDPGYCFAMSLDVVKLMLQHVKQGKPTKPPTVDELSPGKWAIVQSAYEINKEINDKRLIEAQGMEVAGSVPEQAFGGSFPSVAQAVTSQAGGNVFSISSDTNAHALVWYRDDTNKMFLVLDPNSGLWQVTSADAGKQFIQDTLAADYPDLDKYYDYITVTLS